MVFLIDRKDPDKQTRGAFQSYADNDTTDKPLSKLKARSRMIASLEELIREEVLPL